MSVSNLVRLDRDTSIAPAAQHPSPSLVAPSELDSFRFPGESARAVVCGSAGSGKTTLLRRVAALLAAEDIAAVMLRESTAVPTVPAESVLLVDDAHLLSTARVAALAERAADADAGLVLALRSWPVRADLAALSRRMERDRPAILLGDVARAQLRDMTAGSVACHDDVLLLTGGISWLVHECLAAHDEVDCHDAPGHPALQDAIRPRILHRLTSAAPHVRRLIDDLSLGLSPGTDVTASAEEASGLLAEAYAEGLLTDAGRPAPAIAAAVRAMTPGARLVDVVRTASPDALQREQLVAGLEGLRDRRAVDALVARARAEAPHNPDLASDLLDTAVSCGADPSTVALDRAQAAWARGRLDEAGVLLDGLLAQDTTEAPVLAVDLAAAVWAERGMMSLADDTYRAHPTWRAGCATPMRMAAIATGRRPVEPCDPEPRGQDAAPRTPSTLGIASELLDLGLTETLENHPEQATAALQRASELYTASADASPSVELPAVIAAAAAIGTGDLRTAQTIVDHALQGGQGGANRRARLALWSSWIALQRERPADARTALARAMSQGPLTPRDDALAATISIGIARRYEDAAGLAAEWESAHGRLSCIEPDLFSLLALSEVVIAAARLGRGASVQPAFDHALKIVADLGGPPIWSAPLHWAGIQRGILLNQPDALGPHARSLVAAAPRNRLAASMARAGKVWTAVLSGTVDPDAVEEAAGGLAAVGLAWDGARLAGHGASRSDDRKIIARLLACARELHPRENPRTVDDGPDATAADTGAEGVLSDREREVAELVVQGKTYAEIGAAIFISPRTAEHHIAHIRRRLNATSRSDLLSKLRIALDGTSHVPLDLQQGGPRG